MQYDLFRIKLSDFHYSFTFKEFKMEPCKHYLYQVGVRVVDDAEGKPMEGVTVTYTTVPPYSDRRGKDYIEGVTDKGYITNSYHVHVTEPIDAFTKLKFEAQFQHLSPGGAISYVEVPNMQNNLEAVLQVMKFIYDNIIYAELNTKSDYCQVCGWDGEIEIVEDGGKLIWRCPKCGNTDQDKMNVARRTCGYIGTQFWNQGRTQEIKERVLHL